MAQVILPGRKLQTDASHNAVPEGLKDIIDFDILAEAHLSDSRGSGGGGSFEVEAVEGTDIVEVEFADGLKMWQSYDEAKVDFASDTTRSAQDQALLIPQQVHFAGGAATSRGAGTYIVRAVRILRGKPAARAGALTAIKVAHKIEETPLLGPDGKKMYEHGVVKCERVVVDGKGVIKLSKPTRAIPAARKCLIFLHGTFSSTQGSFGDLAAAPKADVWDKLVEAYPGGIYALEHRSVTESPIENAFQVAKSLPKNARVSFITHSRGGLIGELLCRSSRADVASAGAIDATDEKIFGAFGGDLYEAQLEALKNLRDELAEKNLKVEQVVRVAGPIAGTTLASDRLDRYMSVALNVFELVPVLNTTGIAALIKSFMMGFIHTKASPNQLPGLEAMRPTSPLVRMLNRSDVAYSNGLHVVCGDTEPSGVLRRLTVLAADLFFKGDHDFVVDTPSMTRGGVRQTRHVPLLDQGPEVTHFSYFLNAKTRREIVNAAISQDGTLLSRAAPAHQPVNGLPEEMQFPSLVGRSDETSAPVCFVLPGVMGSHLSQNDKWTWVNPLRMALGGLDKLAIDRPDVEASGPIRKYYGEVAEYLSRSHRVIPFDYDWRLSVLEQGHTDSLRKLGKLVKDELERTDQPIRFLAHSMGGLVVRALFQAQPELMNLIKERQGSRFVMLGTPNGGSVKMISTLLGRDPAVRQLEMLDVTNNMTDVLSTVSAMPGPLQLLPDDEDGLYLTPEFWKQMHRLDGTGWVVPQAQDLKAARHAKQALHSVELDPEFTCYVAGLGTDLTLSSIKLDPTKEGRRRIQFFGVSQGDGTVTWKTGIPAGIPTWYLPVPHGDLARTRSSFPALLELLETGSTLRLSSTPPDISRGGVASADPVEVEDATVEIFPEADDVLDGFMGATRDSDLAGLETRKSITKVTLSHGDLRFARYPVAVGHYDGDPLMGAEAALDACLDNHLSQVRDLGIYPGAVNTCEVVLRDGSAPSGAVVIGLGEYGELTPGALTRSLRQALLRYGLLQQQQRRESDEQVYEIGLSTLLIGHLGSNITLQQSIESILDAVAEANRVLNKSPIRHLEIVELFDDRALQAASILGDAGVNGRLGTQFTFDGEVRRVQGARVRASYGPQFDWWQRIIVQRSETEPNKLQYVTISDLGRADFDNTVVPPKVLHDLLNQRTSGTYTPRDVGRMLFELLVPLEMKTFAKANLRQMLILDEAAAAYPWELMEDNFSAYDFTRMPGVSEPGIDPLAVRAPLIRQLITGGDVVPRANTPTALVVADPKNADGLPPLPGAVLEAKAVSELLDHAGLDVTYLPEPDRSFDVLKAMILEPKKMIHLAGHGVYKNVDDGGPGMVLPGGVYLTAELVRSMRYVPEFVFLNCCHIGHVGEEVSEIASSLSVAFLKKGVRAVVAAGWEIDDAAAKLFAQTFYKEMLAGQTFGTAVFRSRVQVYGTFPKTNTWGAYQCYGDPDYQFREGTGGSSNGRSVQTFYSVMQATKAAINIAESAMSVRAKRARMLASLAEIEASAKDGWHSDGDWCAAMGKAYACLEEHAAAIEYLSRARPSLDSIELIQNLSVIRDARAVLAASKTKREAPLAVLRATVKDAIKTLDDLDDLSGQRPTEERFGLRGSAMKRLAWVETNASRRKAALTKMTAYYRKAMEVAAEASPDRPPLYSSLNWIAGHILLGDSEVDGAPVEVWLDRLREEGLRKDREDPNFWNGVASYEIDILSGLRAKRHATPQLADKICSGFKRAWVRGGSFRQSRSLRDQIAFLRHMIDPEDMQAASWLEKIERFVLGLTSELED